jgi:sporulation protein YlmC with PRC-barrel domain
MRTYSSFLGRVVETESGHRFGRCHDLRAVVKQKSATVEALVVGRRGLLEHFGVAQMRLRDAVPWEAVVRIEGDRIVVRDGTEFL